MEITGSYLIEKSDVQQVGRVTSVTIQPGTTNAEIEAFMELHDIDVLVY